MRYSAIYCLILAVSAMAQQRDVPKTDDGWEKLPDGTLGRSTEFLGVGDLPIPAYVRKPAGPGPFPVIVWMHGGKESKEATIRMGRSDGLPFREFVKQGWVLYSADYRPNGAFTKVDYEDTVNAVKAARALPFADPRRVGYAGQSHGANAGTRVVSRVEVSGAVLMAPAAMDYIEIKKAIQAGVKLVPILHKLVADHEKKYGAPMEEIAKDPARYGYTSGITEAAEVRCPLLIENARDDDNSPPSVIAAYVRALKAAGKQVETYEPDTGGHSVYFRDLPESKEAAARAVAFFRRVFAESR
jgi:dipeptidyl aminopeptidase/acylaminoacyl peptidase